MLKWRKCRLLVSKRASTILRPPPLCPRWFNPKALGLLFECDVRRRTGGRSHGEARNLAGDHVAVGQNQWYHFGVGATHFSLF